MERLSEDSSSKAAFFHLRFKQKGQDCRSLFAIASWERLGACIKMRKNRAKPARSVHHER